MRRILVVADQTLGGAELRKRLALKRSTEADLEVFVLVPAVPGETTPVLTGAGTTAASAAGTAPVTPEGGAGVDAAALEAAAARLEVEMSALRALQYQVDGAVGEPDVVAGVRSLLRERPFDEIIVSTLPVGTSRWLRMDLPHRLQRVTKLPVDHVVGEEAQAAEERKIASLNFPGVPETSARGAVRILLVEDNEEDAELTRLALARCSTPNTVHTAANGSEAADYLRSDPGAPGVDLVLVDLKMPVVDGFELLRLLGREQDLERLAVVVLTTSERAEDRERAHALGAHAYITKEAVFPLYRDVLDGLLAELAPGV